MEIFLKNLKRMMQCKFLMKLADFVTENIFQTPSRKAHVEFWTEAHDAERNAITQGGCTKFSYKVNITYHSCNTTHCASSCFSRTGNDSPSPTLKKTKMTSSIKPRLVNG